MKSNQLLVWTDFETDGIDKQNCHVLEVALHVTDQNLEPVTNNGKPFMEVVIKPSNTNWVYEMPPVVREMHTKSGLINDVLTEGIPLDSAAVLVNDFLKKYGKREDKPLVMAGSGVARFDYDIFMRVFPMSAGFFDYYVVDVGILRRTFEMFGIQDQIPPVGEPNNRPHRSGGDIHIYHEELRSYRKVLREKFGVSEHTDILTSVRND